ncbi:MAG: rhodanese-like domain-containing protein [Lewinellaceae bacterium]|nr:rhodanese-like domain-containing protein [Lewinellaceae bacterium]
MKQILFLLFFSSAFLASCQQPGSGTVSSEALAAKAHAGSISEVLPAKAYKEKMEELEASRQLLDVRTPKEYQEGHIEGAVNINFYDDDFLQQLEKQLDKDKPVLLYCRSGRRSANAAKQMQELGFKEVYDLKGGFLQWEK